MDKRPNYRLVQYLCFDVCGVEDTDSAGMARRNGLRNDELNMKQDSQRAAYMVYHGGAHTAGGREGSWKV